MTRTMIAAAALVVLLSACNPIPETPAEPQETRSATPAAVVAPPPPGPFEFIPYNTGMRNLVVLVHARSGCAYVATALQGSSGGYTGLIPLELPDAKGVKRHFCDRAIHPVKPN